MPKLGMEKSRRQELIDATIVTIGAEGYANTTIRKIAKQAGLSVGIISHYFGGKDELLRASMWHLMCQLQQSIIERRRKCTSPRKRLLATVEVIFSEEQSSSNIVKAWLAFWAQVPFSSPLFHLQQIYSRRLLSHLRFDLFQLYPRKKALDLSNTVAILIDGYWLRTVLDGHHPTPKTAKSLITNALKNA
ncbi:MAG: choline-binding transcriptional repressor BetI [Cellvibrionaceae bacterium]